jgi:hypothetical protein
LQDGRPRGVLREDPLDDINADVTLAVGDGAAEGVFYIQRRTERM